MTSAPFSFFIITRTRLESWGMYDDFFCGIDENDWLVWYVELDNETILSNVKRFDSAGEAVEVGHSLRLPVVVEFVEVDPVSNKMSRKTFAEIYPPQTK